MEGAGVTVKINFNKCVTVRYQLVFLVYLMSAIIVFSHFFFVTHSSIYTRKFKNVGVNVGVVYLLPAGCKTLGCWLETLSSPVHTTVHIVIYIYIYI